MTQILYSGLGGHGSVAFSLIRGDQNHRMEHSALFVGVEELRPEYAAQCAELGVTYRAIKKNDGFDWSSWRQVWAALQQLQPDFIVLHSMTLVPVALAYSKRSGCRVIYVDHQPNAVKRPREWFAMMLALLMGRNVVLLTRSVYQELNCRLGSLFPESKAVIINNGIDVDRFVPPAEAPDESQVTICMQSRFSPSKDQATLVRAFAKLREMRPDSKLRLVLAGDGTTWESVRALVEELSLSSLVDMPGMLDEAALLELLHRTNIYVHSSLGEVMSTAVMQAMSTGLPVVGTDIPGINDMVEEGVTGSLFPPGAVERLASILAAWVDQPVRSREMGARARRIAVERFSHVQMFERYAALCS